MQLVADANVLLSAVIGGRAGLVLRHEQVEQVFTPAVAYDEVFEYLAPLAKKTRLRLDTLLFTLAALPVSHRCRAFRDKAGLVRSKRPSKRYRLKSTREFRVRSRIRSR